MGIQTTKAEEGLRTSDFRLPTSDLRLPTSDLRLPTAVAIKAGAPNENIVQNHLNTALLNVF